MKALLTKRSIIIAATSLLLALITIFTVNVFNSTGPVTGFAGAVTNPVRALASTIARTFGDIFAAIYRYEELQARHDELAILVVQLERDFHEAVALAEENARLREALDFRERHGGYETEMATFVSWGSDNWSSTFLINRGYTNSSITRGMGVVTEEGALIGQVFEVGSVQSTVITILDTRFSAATFVGRTDGGEEVDSSVTARGSFEYMRSGLLTLDNIDEGLIVRHGDMVSTLGIGAVFPARLVVGEVSEVFRHATGIGRYATVTPTVDIGSISTVFIITEFDNFE